MVDVNALDITGDAFYLIDWSSLKKRRISHSSHGAEILACADGDDMGLNVKNCLTELQREKKVQNTVKVDSRGLFETITTLHNGGSTACDRQY